MNRLSIDITDEQKQQLKAAAALSGQTLKEYVLSKVLPYSEDEALAMQELKEFIQPRIDEAKQGRFSKKTFAQIKREAYVRVKAK